MTTPLTITTAADYDEHLELAEDLVAESRGLPDGSYAERLDDESKSVGDRLNNTWVEGITIEEWVRRALA